MKKMNMQKWKSFTDSEENKINKQKILAIIERQNNHNSLWKSLISLLLLQLTELLLQKLYKLICKNDTYQLKLTAVLTLDYINIKSRTEIKGSKAVILWWNITLNHRTIKIKGSGNVTVHQQPGFLIIFKKYSQ